jgi:SAM-dependent methyltransferase
MTFDAAYLGAPPPWEIGRPQGEVVKLAELGSIENPVLDVGCGSGENSLYLAEVGYDVLGVDSSPRAIQRARSKASQRSAVAQFLVADALDLVTLKRTFRTAIDSGLFHVFGDPASRTRLGGSIAEVIDLGGHCFVLAASEYATDSPVPFVTRDQIRDAFSRGWRVEDIAHARYETTFPQHRNTRGAAAWLATILRTPPAIEDHWRSREVHQNE